ncbi:MAG: PaaI family thioesterase [Gemmatimonadales bacterium]
MTPSPTIQDHYPDDFAHCYGCGRLNQHGLHLRSAWEGDEVVARFTPRPEHIALPGFVYGGLIAALIDCHAMATAAGFAQRAAGQAVGEGPAPRYVTGALRIDYLRPTALGGELVLRGKVAELGARKAVVQVTLSAGGVETARAEAVAVKAPPSMGGGST